MDKDFEILREVSLSDYLIMIEKKTAAMAEMCCIIGANIAGASRQEIKALARFGKSIGIAFQIQDDLLDITGKESEFGKFVGGDLVEGKKTYLFLKAFEKSRGKDRKDFIRIIEHKGIQQDEIPRFKALYSKLGVLEDAKEEIISYSNKALSELKHLKKQEDRNLFIWLVDSLIKRNK
jgi:geranylgeranyl diphosphate synthase type II